MFDYLVWYRPILCTHTREKITNTRYYYYAGYKSCTYTFRAKIFVLDYSLSVSYTHLDVYNRQLPSPLFPWALVVMVL